jgi:dihydropteroate synthase
MGILNLTPDSFSDGGRYSGPDVALEHAMQMSREGAEVIDIGGESTRPGAAAVPEEEQWRRVSDVIRRLRDAGALAPSSGSAGASPSRAGASPSQASEGTQAGMVLSIDTRSAWVAEQALAAGVSIINDISAGSDPRMFDVTAAAPRGGAAIVLMHMLGAPATMQAKPRYDDVVREVREYLEGRVQAAIRAGVARDRIIIDPGIGFGKTVEHNLTLLAHLEEFVGMGYPVLLGASRKRFIGEVAAAAAPGMARNSEGRAPRERLGGTCATTALGVAAGVAMFRVHDVQANRQAADVAWGVRGRRP